MFLQPPNNFYLTGGRLQVRISVHPINMHYFEATVGLARLVGNNA